MGAMSRRSFLWNMALASASAALLQAGDLLRERGWVRAAEPPEADLVRDTFNGLIAFVVPGPDAYSVAQGVSTPESGGLDTGIGEVLITTLDQTTPFVTGFSATIAELLNGLALAVNPSAPGPFISPFARLAYPEKAVVFQIMDATEPLKPLAGVLPAFVAYLCYSEPSVGWRLSSYQGVADGRDELQGYFKNRNSGR